MTVKVWLVTGSSSGIGLSVLNYALSKGDIAVATLRHPEDLCDLRSQYPLSQLLVLKLDVSKPDEIVSAFTVALETFGRIDVVYNNAGYGFLLEFESAPDGLARDLFEVNFWGAANVSKEAIRVFRDCNNPPGGRLIQASSGAGLLGVPTASYYCASKFALTGLSEVIVHELDPSWNIKVIILNLGGFRTRSLDALTILPQDPLYAFSTFAIRSFVDRRCCDNIGDSDKAAREIHRIANDDDVPLYVSLGLDSIETSRRKVDILRNNVEKSIKYCMDLK